MAVMRNVPEDGFLISVPNRKICTILYVFCPIEIHGTGKLKWRKVTRDEPILLKFGFGRRPEDATFWCTDL